MASLVLKCFQLLREFVLDTTPRPGLHPIADSKPLTFTAAVLPPLIYYLALLLLAPPPTPVFDRLSVKLFRNVLALIAGTLFFRLALQYYVPQSIVLTYKLGLVGLTFAAVGYWTPSSSVRTYLGIFRER